MNKDRNLVLSAFPRTIFGRKVKKLREQGLIPAHVFGHKIKTIHVQVNENEFVKIEKAAGEATIINLKTNGELRPVLIRNIQTDPVTDKILHIDFYQVNLKEKVRIKIPIEIVGESPAVESKQGVLLTPLSEIEIEALPTNLPDSVKVDISKLEKLDDAILVKDLKLPAEVEILEDKEETVVKIGELVTKEAEEILAEEAAERAATETVTEEVSKAEEEEGKQESVDSQSDKE